MSNGQDHRDAQRLTGTAPSGGSTRRIAPRVDTSRSRRARRSSGRAPRARRLSGLGVAALLFGAFVVPAPGSADPVGSPTAKRPAPTIRSVETRLDTLNRQAEIASEAYNTVRVQMRQANARLTGLQADLERQKSQVSELRSRLVGAALSDYASRGGLSTSSSFLVATQPRQFIDALAVTAIVESRQAGLLDELRQQQNQLGLQEQQAQRELAAVRADRATMSTHKVAVESRLAAAQKLLRSLKAEARARVIAQQRRAATTADTSTTTATSRAAERPPASSSAPASGRAAVAVATALAQLGKPYVWGTAGPYSFDCSGLTMYAWAAAGVSLSHSSSVQSQQGTAVSISALQPGDLVFYYPGSLHHVAIYIGGGMVVHAPHTGDHVRMATIERGPIAGYRRPG